MLDVLPLIGIALSAQNEIANQQRHQAPHGGSGGVVLLSCGASFYEPPADDITGQIGASLEEQTALTALHPYGISVALATHTGCCLPDIHDLIDHIPGAVLPGDYLGEHSPFRVVVNEHFYIYFLAHSVKTSSPVAWAGPFSP